MPRLRNELPRLWSDGESLVAEPDEPSDLEEEDDDDDDAQWNEGLIAKSRNDGKAFVRNWSADAYKKQL